MAELSNEQFDKGECVHKFGEPILQEYYNKLKNNSERTIYPPTEPREGKQKKGQSQIRTRWHKSVLPGTNVTIPYHMLGSI